MNIVMMGTGTFAEPTFEALLKAFPGEVVGLVTQPSKEVGRRTGASRQTGAGMDVIAKAHSIPVLQPASINSEDGLTQLAALNPDLLVVAAYGQILKPSVLAIPKLGAINVHASLLPKYRGAAPVAHAILNGEKETGVTIIRITPGLDAGDMLAREATAIGEQETTGGLESRLAVIGARLAVDTAARMKAGPVAGQPQDASEATKAPKIRKDQGLIDWSRDCFAIADQIRACQPWPTAYTFLHRPGLGTLRVIVKAARVHVLIGCGYERPPGGTISNSQFTIGQLSCWGGDSSIVELLELQPAGRTTMTAAEFLRGHPLPAGSFFGPERP